MIKLITTWSILSKTCTTIIFEHVQEIFDNILLFLCQEMSLQLYICLFDHTSISRFYLGSRNLYSCYVFKAKLLSYSIGGLIVVTCEKDNKPEVFLCHCKGRLNFISIKCNILFMNVVLIQMKIPYSNLKWSFSSWNNKYLSHATKIGSKKVVRYRRDLTNN